MAWQARADRLFIDGAWSAPSGRERIDIISPLSERTIAELAAGDAEDIDRAVGAARRAFDRGPWPRASLEERMSVVRELGRLIGSRQGEIAALITDEMGCPIAQSLAIQAANPHRIIEAYLGVAAAYPFRSIRQASTGNALVTREPVGVVAAIVPWNVPMGISVQKVVPAVLAGCTVILKPTPQTALDAYLLGELIEQAGFPPGVVNIVPAEREVSEYLVGHPGVDKVTFTGSTAAGRRIASLCGHDLRRVTLELGGKSAAIVLDDADLDATVETMRMGAFRNNGQVCTLKTRLLVPERLEDAVVQRLDAMVASMAVGDPTHASTQIGPLVSAAQRIRVEQYISSGVEQGARVVRGGGRPAGLDRGWFIEPTVFSAVKPDMVIAQEEIFGPVLSVLTYAGEDAAIDMANASPFGLHGAVFSSDIDRALAVASRLRTGAVEVNGNPIGLAAPFGGFKSSGLGRENGPEGLDAYVETRSIGIDSHLAATLATNGALTSI